ncbi:toxin-antitoxin system HicB family antitoxin [Luteimonas qiangzhengi]|uniref:toxin-antitoxin system HicB family antitoxin n=1 Tax=Luteimonas sp. MJ146 TaxID=3129240 RepID=UPI0031BB7D96
MTDAHAYNITIRKAVIEGEDIYEARIRELPDVTEYADTAEEAHALAIDTIETTATILAERGQAMPVPYVPADDYSGRVTLRLPRSLHRALAEAADSERVSLNQHLVGILTYVCGIGHGVAAQQTLGLGWNEQNVGAYSRSRRTTWTRRLRISESRDLSTHPSAVEV